MSVRSFLTAAGAVLALVSSAGPSAAEGARPALTRPDGKASTEDRFPSAVDNGVTHIGFTFDHEWEMEPGRWTFVISASGQEIARKEFTVSIPPPGAPNSDCGVG